MSGVFILSLDTEIAWGTYTHTALSARATAFERYPELIRRLIRQLDIYEIPATWAIVGYLLLPQGTSTTVTQPRYTFATTPDSTRLEQHPAAWFHGRWIADAIQNMRVPQEIGSHTFTHLLATDPAVTREMFAEQLAAAQRAHQNAGLPPPRSLVYPQDRVAYTDLLPAHGFTAYRGVEQRWYTGLPKIMQRPAHLLDRTLGTAPPTYAPASCDEGDIVNLPASQFLMSYDGVRRHIPTAARVRQARLGLRKAIENDEIFHLWFHPFNLASSDAMIDALVQILALVWAARERGDLRTLTMAAAADEITFRNR